MNNIETMSPFATYRMKTKKTQHNTGIYDEKIDEQPKTWLTSRVGHHYTRTNTNNINKT